MKTTIKTISSYEYKKHFLSGTGDQVLRNNENIQVYNIENVLREIIIPANPYRVSFNFLLFVRKGSIVQFLENEEHVLNAGSILLVKQGCVTTTLKISADATGYILIYENDVIQRITLQQRLLTFSFIHPHVRLRSETGKWLSQLLYLMKTELSDNHNDINTSISLLKAFLYKLLQEAEQVPAAINRNLDITLRFNEYLQEDHQLYKSVSHYARRLNISESYLNKCVKSITGKPPKQCINEISIQHSILLLQDQTRDIASIAFELNFQSTSYFTRLFRKVTGLSPTDYRKKMAAP
jgi:AraC-like DNA-binding protein